MISNDPKLVMVRRKTRLTELVERYNTIEQAKFYIQHLGADFDDYLNEDKVYNAVLQRAKASLQSLGITQVVDRSFLPNFVFGPNDVVVVVGQDGLVANTVKYLNGQPVIAINPDPLRWDGILLPFRVDDIPTVVSDVIRSHRPYKEITLAKAELNNGQSAYAVNDFFIGPKSHTSARYERHYGNQHELQSSSGVIISTGLGSTGWLQSLLAGASGIHGNSKMGALAKEVQGGFDWASKHLIYTVR